MVRYLFQIHNNTRTIIKNITRFRFYQQMFCTLNILDSIKLTNDEIIRNLFIHFKYFLKILQVFKSLIMISNV